ncbi:MAG TPA: T9SS type A sorting domain-containing protein [Caldithrix abyssi]|uniref:T9SS type A sorting domain-containing protein n=1 Tax=Caldithrix abyssi TaxID=187145 RepID=A0A7V4WTE6_CALAY|nr:T9SS type A sorting domain-containing protein [Caldithrix abyssi]
MLRIIFIKGIWFILLSFLFLRAQGQEDGTYGLSMSDVSCYVNNGNTKSNSVYCSNAPFSHYGGGKRRTFYQWELTDDIIPDGSTITSVRIVISDITSPDNIQLRVNFYNVALDIGSSTGSDLWQKTDDASNAIGEQQSNDYTIDYTYPEGSGFATAVQNALPSDFFTLGLKDANESTHNYEYQINNCKVKLEIHFKRPSVNVTVNQFLEDQETIVGEVKRWNGSNFDPLNVLPANLTFYAGTQEIMQGDQRLFSNNPKQKYNNWNEQADVTNHHVFKITTSVTEYYSYLKKSYDDITIKATLTKGGEGTSIYFKDPWLIDYADPDYGSVKRNRGMDEDGSDKLEFKQRSSPFVPDYTTDYNGDVYQGVFLNQGYENGTWNPPYYSAKAEAEQSFNAHGESITGYFQYWDGTDVQYQNSEALETPLVFKAAGAEARAVYKGHLASAQNRPSGLNFQRSICRTDDGMYHLVYEDDGKIWYASSDDGQQWNKETLISSGGECRYPSIAAYQNSVYVVWTDVDKLLNHYIYFRQKDASWSAAEIADSVAIPVEISADSKTAASIAVWNDNGAVKPLIVVRCYEEYDHDQYQKKLYFTLKENSAWSGLAPVMAGINPSLSADRHSSVSNGVIGLAYENDGTVLYYQYNGSWNHSINVSGYDAWRQNQKNASLVLYNGNAHIVWEGYNSDKGINEIYYKKLLKSEIEGQGVNSAVGSNYYPYNRNPVWVSSPTTEYAYSPSVSVNSSEEAAFFYHKSDKIYKKKYTSDGWYRYDYNSSGRYPSMTQQDLNRAVWTKYSDAPYLVKSAGAEPYNPGGWHSVIYHPRDDQQTESVVRFTYPLDSTANNGQSGYIAIDVLNVKFDGDTLNIDEAFRSDSMNVTNPAVPLELDLKARYVNVQNGLDSNQVMFKVDFLDNGDSLFLTSLKYHELPANAGPDGERFFKLATIVNLAGHSGRLRLRFADLEPEIFIIQSDDVSGQSKPAPEPVTAVIPERYRLRQNFPNPFNPSTHITVDLPKDGAVNLSVYNVQGQKVAELLSGYKTAGSYEVIFDGSGLSSGMYFYRLSAPGFTDVKRMLLVK